MIDLKSKFKNFDNSLSQEHNLGVLLETLETISIFLGQDKMKTMIFPSEKRH